MFITRLKKLRFKKYRVAACNVGCMNSSFFDHTDKRQYDLMLRYVFDGRLWNVSIYTHHDHIDCSYIAECYGGGGHKKAAGFECKRLPFKKQRKKGGL
jgi:oligoribonuclease NrnB/cAMP/cGMP phosphodiesterase (DHH superfamily)